VGYDDIVDDSYRGGLAIDHEDARVKVSVEVRRYGFVGTIIGSRLNASVYLSCQEAHRLAQIHRNELLKSHKLIMVVDLDQTIIHAAVDPTIGEWLNECGFWESSKLGNGKKSHQDGKEKSPSVPAGGDKSSGDTAQKGKESPHQEEPSPSKRSNPNKEALKDVFRFQLPNELPPGFGKGRFSQILPEEDGDGCWYYVKPR
jgi:RNA polymerase II subunit A-like phosphatase